MRIYVKAGNAVDAGVAAMFSGSIAEYAHIRRTTGSRQAGGFRPQFRGQSYGAFKFLLNAIYLASAQPQRE